MAATSCSGATSGMPPTRFSRSINNVPRVLRKGLIEPVLAVCRSGRTGRAGAHGLRPPRQYARRRADAVVSVSAHPRLRRDFRAAIFLQALGGYPVLGHSVPALCASPGARSSRPAALCGREDHAGGQRSAQSDLHVGAGRHSDPIPVPRPLGGGVLGPHSGPA